MAENRNVPKPGLEDLIRLGRCKGCGTKRWLIAGPKDGAYEGLCQPCYAEKLKAEGVITDA